MSHTTQELVARCEAVGITIQFDPVTGLLSLPGEEILASCLVALERVHDLHARVTVLERQSHSLKPWDVIG